MGLEADCVVASLLRHRPRFVAAALAVVRHVHDADDVFQQVVLGALEHRAALNDADHLLAWAFKATRHRAVDVARRKHLRPFPDRVLDLLEAEWGDPAEAPCPDRVAALWACLSKLTDTARTVLRMKYFDGTPVAGIAAAVGRSEDAVYQMLSRTHRALKGCVEIEVNGPPSDRSLPAAADARRGPSGRGAAA